MIHRAPAGEQRGHDDQEEQRQAQADCPQGGLGLEIDELRDPLDRAAEGRGGCRPEDRAARQARAVLADPVHPGERPQPLLLGGGPLWPVVEPLLALPPVTEEAEPLELAARRRGGGNEHRPRIGLNMGLRGVVAADARAVRPVLDVDRVVVEGGVRAGGRVDDRVRPVLLDLGVVPIGPFAARVLEEGDLGGALRQGLRGRVRVERDLHPLPVALVDVVELVEVVEEPVLDDQARVARLGGDVRVGDRGRLALSPQCLEVRRVAAHFRALNVEGIPRQVEVVVVAKTGDIRRRGCLS